MENAERHLEKPYVIMISLDGYRYDYTKKYDPPNIKRFMKRGFTPKVYSGFPSKTFPNHYSIVTGLYAGNHGIVANSFYDPKRKQRYKLGTLQRQQTEPGIAENLSG